MNKTISKTQIAAIVAGLTVIVFVAVILSRTPDPGGSGGNINRPSAPANQQELVQVAGSDQTPIDGNAAWCATLQICWRNMRTEGALGLDGATFTTPNKLAEELESGAFSPENLNNDHYFAYSGRATTAAKEEIEQDLRERFDQTSDILDSLSWEDDERYAMWLFYAMLYRAFHFEVPFDEYPATRFGSEEGGNRQEDVSYFGFKRGDADEDMVSQVKPLYYQDSEHFAAQVKTKEGDTLVLVRSPEGETFDEMWENLVAAEAQEHNLALVANRFICPELVVDLLRDYTELEGLEILKPDGSGFEIARALQTIQMRLDREGGEIKSEAAIEGYATAAAPDETPYTLVNLDFTDDFVLFVVDGTAVGDDGAESVEYPYFALHVHDISAFQDV